MTANDFATIVVACTLAMTAWPGCSNMWAHVAASGDWRIDLELEGVPDSTQVELAPVTHVRDARLLAAGVVVDGRATLQGSSPEGPEGARLRMADGSGWLPLVISDGECISVRGHVVETGDHGTSVRRNYDFSRVSVEGSELSPRLLRMQWSVDSMKIAYERGLEPYREVIESYTTARQEERDSDRDSIAGSQLYRDYKEYSQGFYIELEERFRGYVLDGADSYWGPMTMLYLYHVCPPSMRELYEEFGPEARDSRYGQELRKELYPVGRPGDILPDFKSVDAGGDTIMLSRVARGSRYVLLDFWASWCAPCRKEIPRLKEIYSQWRDHGLEIVSVSIDKDDNAWHRALEAERMPWRNCRDTAGDIAKAYSVRGVPMLVIMDSDGCLVAENLRGEALAKRITELFDSSER